MGAAFLLLDASDRAITLCWDREPGVSVECVQMKAYTRQPDGEGEGGGERRVEAAPSSNGGGESKAGADGDGGGDGWVTLSEALGSSALKKNKLAPGTAYVFRRRPRKQVRFVRCLRCGTFFFV